VNVPRRPGRLVASPGDHGTVRDGLIAFIAERLAFIAERLAFIAERLAFIA
jgi:hypothetical protein